MAGMAQASVARGGSRSATLPMRLPWQPAAEERLQSASSKELRSARSITAFFPAYNDAETIGLLIAYSLRALTAVCDDYEVIVVNDGSTDTTAAVLDLWQQRDERVRVVTHETNRGYGGALISGFAAATKELVFYTDGDGQYDPTELLELLPRADECDVVQGYKIVRRDAWYRTVIGRFYHRVAKLAFGLQIRDVDCDFRLMRRELFDYLQLECNLGFICTELMKKAQDLGARIVEVPVHHYPRVFGHSMFFTPRVLRIAPLFARYWWQLVAAPALGRLLPPESFLKVRRQLARLRRSDTDSARAG